MFEHILIRSFKNSRSQKLQQPREFVLYFVDFWVSQMCRFVFELGFFLPIVPGASWAVPTSKSVLCVPNNTTVVPRVVLQWAPSEVQQFSKIVELWAVHLFGSFSQKEFRTSDFAISDSDDMLKKHFFSCRHYQITVWSC